MADKNFTQPPTDVSMQTNNSRSTQVGYKVNPAPLIFGIASIVLFIVPFVNFILATIGLSLAAVQTRRKAETTEGDVYMVYEKWSRTPGITKAGFFVSLAGMFTSVPSLVFGTVGVLSLFS